MYFRQYFRPIVNINIYIANDQYKCPNTVQSTSIFVHYKNLDQCQLNMLSSSNTFVQYNRPKFILSSNNYSTNVWFHLVRTNIYIIAQ